MRPGRTGTERRRLNGRFYSLQALNATVNGNVCDVNPCAACRDADATTTLCGATGLLLLRHRAEGYRLQRELAGRVSARPLRTQSPYTQEVCLPGGIVFPSNRVCSHGGLGTLAGRARRDQPAKSHEKPIVSILPRSRQRLPSNRPIRPAPRALSTTYASSRGAAPIGP
jgi:hypothetical protein